MMRDALLIATALLTALTLAGFFARWSWLCELASHFRVQYAALLAACAGIWWWMGSPVALVAAVAMAINLALVLPCAIGRRDGDGHGRRTVRVMTINVNGANQAYDRMLRAIQEVDADVVVLSEIHEAWLAGLDPLREVYRHGKAMLYRGRGFGIALMSRLPLERVEIRQFSPTNLPSVIAVLSVDGQPVTIIGTHPLAPIERVYARLRNEQLGELARFILAQPTPVVLVGDLNTSPWSAYFGQLVRIGRLRDSRAGFGVQPTWPAGWPWLRIPIDHCLVSEGVRVHARRVGPPVGSDHLPLIIELSVDASLSAPQESRA